MRRSVFAVLLVSAVICAVVSSCDLLNREVVTDDGGKVMVMDSTTIRNLASVPDSTQLVIKTDAPWHADVAKGCDWCTLSKNDGPKGRDTIRIYVAENTDTHARQTSIVVEAGNKVMVFKVNQVAAETWHDIPYWHRTAAQRMGLHGRVKEMIVTNNRYTTESETYTFDSEGNLMEVHSIDNVATQYDTTRTYDYDDVNHRIRCTVKEDLGGTVVRKWRYEYANLGKLVAYSAYGWTDPDPLAEDMEGMIVPDLSAVFKTWYEGETEFHENRTYSFAENDSRLMITTDKWKVVDGVRTDMGRDTMRVSYQYYNSCGLSLPCTSRDIVTNSAIVTNSGYYSNGMLKMMVTATSSYDFLENPQRMAVLSYAYNGPADAPHEVDSYECVYNSNRDLLERKIRYSGSTGVTIENYPQYQYDEEHNWTARVEEIHRPQYTEPIIYATKREFIYYR